DLGNPQTWQDKLCNAGEDEDALNQLMDQLLALPERNDDPFDEPSELDAIKRLRPAGISLPPCTLSDEHLYDRLYGAWLGRCCGCALGKPVEPFMGKHNGLSSRQRIKQYLTAIDPSEYPISDYIPQYSPAQEQTGKTNCKPSTREHIAYMESDDDIRYTVLGQLVLRDKGLTFTSWDIVEAWWKHLPYRFVCTAETQAYRNMVIRYGFDTHKHPQQVDWQWIATHHNPYRQWIGADIRVDSWAYACPGNPQLAAELAWRDARISHVKNGIYGAMFMAAMIASAFVCDDPLTIIQSGLAQIPASSRLYLQMQQVIEICTKHDCDPNAYESVFDEIEKLLGHYHPVHTNNNAGIVVGALLLGKHDFQTVISLAVMGGWDTDCNAATAGSILGAMHGAVYLPEKWTHKLNDKLLSEVVGYHPIAISECAQRSLEIVQADRC
ncbi:MAG TPA: ADP-ribosylglycohydrolase family protein, partial [Phycisphaerales bacterium]|nr:ADP-ribosylglycohydrolase family protein [Phycisphaerales bacterium]